MTAPIDTERFSKVMRDRSFRDGRFLIAKIAGSEQEADLTEAPVCDGVGRIRHFRRGTSSDWPENPLPLDPACAKLGLPRSDELEALVFQNAACNWRCWYCYVPFDRLGADERTSQWLSADELVTAYQTLAAPPSIIDLSGGQPDLIPEWVPAMMRSLRAVGLDARTYLWSDDNLSTDYFWRYLSDEDIEMVRSYRNYGRVGCFKGFDAVSFAFNTGADPQLFHRQFELFSRLRKLGIDQYAYATFTGPSPEEVEPAIKAFVDDLQRIADGLPLRTVPLEIRQFGVVEARQGGPISYRILDVQHRAINAWQNEISRRFTSKERALPITSVPW